MSEFAFLEHLDAGGTLAKSSNLHAHVAKAAHALHKEHADMARFHKGIHDSLDDSHADKSTHKRLHEHHLLKAGLYKSLHDALNPAAMTDDVSRGGESSGFGYTTGDLDGPGRKALVPDHVRGVIPSAPPSSVHLIPRNGGAGREVAKVDARHEEMFGNM